MRIAALLFMLAMLALGAGAGRSESLDRAPIGAVDPHPTAAEVIARLYEFDAFQQAAIDRTAALSNSDVQNVAALRAEAALQRDQALVALQYRAGKADISRPAAGERADELAALDSAEGPAFVRSFYAAQLAQYEMTVSVLERYLQSPDIDDVKNFAAAQLPRLRAELEDTRAALAEK